jgi:hypothetical protein
MTIEVPTIKGHRRKFTPERIEQIKNLVERGVSREEIAAIVEVTIGTLQVTCSRLGISLRRKHYSLADKPTPPVNGNNDRRRVRRVLALTIRINGRERTTEMSLSDDIIARCAVDASVQGLTMAELIARLLTEKYK